MESLLILLAIVALQVGAAWFKKRIEGSKNPSVPTDESPEEYLDEGEENHDAPSDAETPDSLQDLIRKFREEQAKTMDVPENGDEESPPEPEPVLASPRSSEPIEKETVSPKVFEDSFPSVAELNCVPFPEKKTEVEPEPVSAFAMPTENPEAGPRLNPTPVRADFEFSRENARKGFLWARVLEDPRFKRRSPMPLSRR